MGGGETAEIVLLDRIGQADRRQGMIDEVRAGLTAGRKELSPKYFYDRRGSELFEEITRLDEYYQTRAERSILERIVPHLATDYPFTDLIEFGSGSSAKTRLLLETLSQDGPLRSYHPIDVSRDFLLETAHGLAEDFPSLDIRPVLGDFADGLEQIETSGPTLSIFLGGTIGNLYPEEAVRFLATVRDGMGSGDALLLGCDLVKDPARLHAAYNDSRGVTAAFNRNVLTVLNRELQSRFELDTFAHYAPYNPPEQRIEMHLVSLRRQSVDLGLLGATIELGEGESILTEISRKFTRRSAGDMLEAARFRIEEWWTDPEENFALALAVPTGGRG